MHVSYKDNFETANLLLNSYSKMCDTIIMFNLIIAIGNNKIVYICVMFQFTGNIIKNDAKKTDLFPRCFCVGSRGWLYTGYCQKQLKTLFC